MKTVVTLSCRVFIACFFFFTIGLSNRAYACASPSISGDTVACRYTTGHIYSTKNVSKSSYSWSVSGGTITAGQGTNSISVKWNTNGSGSVSVTETDSSSCSTTVSRTVTILARPTPVISGSTTVCKNTSGHTYSTTNVSGSAYTWTVSGGTITSGQNSSSIKVSWANSGSGSLSLTETNSLGCDTTVTESISIGTAPVPVISGPSVYCRNTSGHTYSVKKVSGNTYTWTVTGGTITAGQNTDTITVSWGGNASGTVSVTESAGSGCKGSDSITIYAVPVAAFSYSGLCKGNATSFNNTSFSAGTSTYFWDFGDGTTSTSSAPSKTYSKAGSYTVLLKVTSSLGCKDSVTKSITISDYPAPSISGSSGACAKETSQYAATSDTGSSYVWTVTGGTIASGQNTDTILVTWSSGSGSVSVKETNSSGCDSIVSKPVTIHPLPSVAFSIADNCADSSLSISNTSTISSGSVSSYKWDFGDSTTSTSAVPSKTYKKAGTFTVWLVATSDKGCKDSVSKQVTIHPRPYASFSFTDVCQGKQASFTNNSTGYSSKLVDWNFGDGTTSSDDSPKKIYGKAGTYTVWLKVMTQQGCTDSTSRTITIYSLPALAISGKDTMCAKEGTTYSSANVSGNTYQWTVTGGTIASGQNTNAIQVLWDTAGKGAITLKETNSHGCDTTVSLSVTIRPRAVMDVTIYDGCAGQPVYIVNKSAVAGDSLSYIWQFSDGTSSTQAQPVKIFDTAKIYNVLLLATTSSGCQDTFFTSIKIHPKPGMDFSLPDICAGDSITFSHVLDSNESTYSWRFHDGTQPGLSVRKAYADPGTYQVTLIITTKNGCQDSSSRYLAVHPRAKVSFNSISPCFGDSTLFQNTSTISGGNISSYFWSLGDGTTSTEKNPVHLYKAPGWYQVTLKVITDNGCTDSFGDAAYVKPLATADFTAAEVCDGNDVVFNNTSFGDTLGPFKWFFGDGNSSNQENPVHRYAKTGKYNVELIANNNMGCYDTLRKTVTVHAIPNADFSFLNACTGEPVKLSDLSTIAGDTIKTRVWVWDTSDTLLSAEGDVSYTSTKAGKYRVELFVYSGFGCMAARYREVEVFANPDISFTYSAASRTVSFTPSDTTLAKYYWSFGDSTGSTSHSPVKTYAANGKYPVALLVKSKDSCQDVFLDTIIINVIGMEEPAENTLWKVHPNPVTSKQLTIVSDEKVIGSRVHVKLFDASGRCVMDQMEYIQNKRIIQLPTGLTPGVYNLHLQSDEKSETLTLIIQ